MAKTRNQKLSCIHHNAARTTLSFHLHQLDNNQHEHISCNYNASSPYKQTTSAKTDQRSCTLLQFLVIMQAATSHRMYRPCAELSGLQTTEQRSRFSRCELTIDEKHLNPHRVAHGAVLHALADTGTGAALYPRLTDGELCATVQIIMNYFEPVQTGVVTCTSEVINRGKTVAHIVSKLFVAEVLVAPASVRAK